MIRRRLLIVDDEPDVCRFIADAAEDLGYECVIAHSGKMLRRSRAEAEVDAIVLDLKIPDEDGIEILNSLAEGGFGGSLILLSGTDAKVIESAARLAKAHGLNLHGALQKPILLSSLTEALRSALAASGTAAISREDLEAAIADDQFVLHYQPKVDLEDDGGIRSLEALVRWEHPSRGLLSPGEFVPAIEGSGLSAALADWVLEAAGAQARRWQDESLDIAVAVNLSAPLAVDPGLPDRIAALLDSHGVPGHRLILEITESGVMSDTIKAMASLTRVLLKDVALSIDDFGTGYSSLVQLYRMPFSEVKIDLSFVREIETSQEARVVVRSIIDLAHNLGMTACAEGVETEATATLLKAWRCDKAQGFYFAPPLPAQDATALLRRPGRPGQLGATAPGRPLVEDISQGVVAEPRFATRGS